MKTKSEPNRQVKSLVTNLASSSSSGPQCSGAPRSEDPTVASTRPTPPQELGHLYCGGVRNLLGRGCGRSPGAKQIVDGQWRSGERWVRSLSSSDFHASILLCRRQKKPSAAQRGLKPATG